MFKNILSELCQNLDDSSLLHFERNEIFEISMSFRLFSHTVRKHITETVVHLKYIEWSSLEQPVVLLEISTMSLILLIEQSLSNIPDLSQMVNQHKMWKNEAFMWSVQNLSNEINCHLVVFFSFSAESANEIAREWNIRKIFANSFHEKKIIFSCVSSGHPFEDDGAATLCGEVQVVADVVVCGDHLKHFIRKIFWMRWSETNAHFWIDLCNLMK